MGSIQRTKPVIERFANTSHDIRVVGTSLHRVLSNVVGSMLLASLNFINSVTNTSINDAEALAEIKVSLKKNSWT